MKTILLATVCVLALPGVAMAQQATNSDKPTTEVDTAASTDTGNYQGDIIVTATKRSQKLSEVPIAVSAVTAAQLQNSGAVDIRALNQLSPSLLVSSTSSEAGAGTARIRGIGTVGENPGLESSVATFIDGVYRSRSGVGLTELGAVERIEVLRGPQGTLFGRNASAGLISVTTAQPKFNPGGYATLSYGNYNALRIEGGVTGGIGGDKVAGRIDGVYFKRDGFLEDVISGDEINNRNRWLVRGQLLFVPNDDLTIRLIGDYADRNEDCCGSDYDPARTVTKGTNGNLNISSNNSVINLLRSLGGVITDTPYSRKTSITPGRSYNSDVTDWGISGQIDWSFSNINLTSITAYRDWKWNRAQDADFNNVDILYRTDYQQEFKTFSQELRFQGDLMDGRLNWLVGGYYANEKLTVADDLSYGQQYQAYGNGLIAATGRTYNQIFTLLGKPADFTMNGKGLYDTYAQTSNNWALFTHEEFKITEALTLTAGIRYTSESKSLDAVLTSADTGCATIQTSAFAALSGVPCVINNRVNGSYSGKTNETAWSGTVVLSYQIQPDLMAYGSYARGYKAGGYNLDRAALLPAAPALTQLEFAPETVNAYELGAKFNGRDFNFNAALFYSAFNNFQLNTFNGTNFLVENIAACKSDLGGQNANGSGKPCAPDNTKAGVTTKGVELEAVAYITSTFQVGAGFTYANVTYDQQLTGYEGRPLPAALALLPGQHVSNAPLYVTTGSMTWTPPIPGTDMSALFYADYRFTSGYNSGSDLFSEKYIASYGVINARIGINGPKDRWSVELWAQNLLNTNYNQVTFGTPLQGSSSAALVAKGYAAAATTLFGQFVAEPRLFGATVRARF